MKRIGIATTVVGFLSAVVALLQPLLEKKSLPPVPQRTVTLSVDGKDNRLNGVTTVNEAHVVNVSNTFYGEDSHRKTAKTGSELVGQIGRAHV